jgi:hypothetical protein
MKGLVVRDAAQVLPGESKLEVRLHPQVFPTPRMPVVALHRAAYASQ